MIRNTTQLGDKELRAENEIITDVNSPKVKQVIQDLIDTMKAKDLIGMAAPQIGENYKIFITNPRKTQYRSDGLDDELRIYINPKIVFLSKEKVTIYEGCGSIKQASEFGPVERSKVVQIEALDENGRKFKIKADGLLGRVIQHEFDHINGIEFIDKVADMTMVVTKEIYIRDIKDSPERANNLKITIKEVLN